MQEEIKVGKDAVGYIGFPYYSAAPIEIKDEASLRIARQVLDAIARVIESRQSLEEMWKVLGDHATTTVVEAKTIPVVEPVTAPKAVEETVVKPAIVEPAPVEKIPRCVYCGLATNVSRDGERKVRGSTVNMYKCAACHKRFASDRSMVTEKLVEILTMHKNAGMHIGSIATALGCDRDVALYHVIKLIKQGLVDVEKRRNSGKRRIFYYLKGVERAPEVAAVLEEVPVIKKFECDPSLMETVHGLLKDNPQGLHSVWLSRFLNIGQDKAYAALRKLQSEGRAFLMKESYNPYYSRYTMVT